MKKMMTDKKSLWQTEELVRTYLQGVRGAIPGADLQLAVIGKVAQQWIPAPVNILDLGCGNGILGRYLLNTYPSARGLFLDFSEPMLVAARTSMNAQHNAIVTNANFASPQWLEVAEPHGPFDIVVSGFAIHHQPDHRKRALYAEIFSLLAPGGVFLNLEHVASATEAGVEMFDDFFVDHLVEFHRQSIPETSRLAVEDSYYARDDKTENILALVEDQCQWLRQVGFADVDCFFKLFELALFGGRRPISLTVPPAG
jgi:tRNA (cmo5U34)-methyltransferase